MNLLINKNCLVYDLRTLNIMRCDSDKGILETLHFSNLQEFQDFYLQSVDRNTIILVGTPEQIRDYKQELKQLGLDFCFYDIKHVEPLNSVDEQLVLGDIVSSLDEMKSLLKKDYPKVDSGVFVNISEIKELAEFKTMLQKSLGELVAQQERIQYLVEEVYNRDSSSLDENYLIVIDDLRKELAAYKNDFYLKSMQKLGVNIVIEILERLYNEKYAMCKHEINDSAMETINQLILYCESKMKKLNIKTKQSGDGDEFDGSRMKVYDDRKCTENEELKGRVALSIFPAIYWTLPRVNAPGADELLIKEEIVSLYE